MIDSKNISTQFNAGILSVQRLNTILTEINNFSRLCGESDTGLEALKLYYGSLRVFYLEICSKLQRAEIVRIKGIFHSLKRFTPIIVWEAGQWEYKQKIHHQNYAGVYRQLQYAEQVLRIFADRKGLLVPNKLSPSDSISDME